MANNDTIFAAEIEMPVEAARYAEALDHLACMLAERQDAEDLPVAITVSGGVMVHVDERACCQKTTSITAPARISRPASAGFISRAMKAPTWTSSPASSRRR